MTGEVTLVTERLPMIAWQDMAALPVPLRVVLSEGANGEVATLERMDGKDALGAPRWVRASEWHEAAKALSGMAQLLRDTIAEVKRLHLARPEAQDPHQQAVAAYRAEGRPVADPPPAAGPLCLATGDQHRFSIWQRSPRLGTAWRQCGDCGAVDVRSAQAGREALDPNDPAYLSPAVPSKLSPQPAADPPF